MCIRDRLGIEKKSDDKTEELPAVENAENKSKKSRRKEDDEQNDVDVDTEPAEANTETATNQKGSKKSKKSRRKADDEDDYEAELQQIKAEMNLDEFLEKKVDSLEEKSEEVVEKAIDAEPSEMKSKAKTKKKAHFAEDPVSGICEAVDSLKIDDSSVVVENGEIEDTKMEIDPIETVPVEEKPKEKESKSKKDKKSESKPAETSRKKKAKETKKESLLDKIISGQASNDVPSPFDDEILDEQEEDKSNIDDKTEESKLESEGAS